MPIKYKHNNFITGVQAIQMLTVIIVNHTKRKEKHKLTSRMSAFLLGDNDYLDLEQRNLNMHPKHFCSTDDITA